MQTVKTVAAIAVLGVLLLPFPSQTLAQQSPAQQPSVQRPPPAQQTDVNENELRSFAKVYVQIQKIRQTYEPQLKEAKTPEEGKQLQNEEVSKMQQAIKQEGMSEESYKRIISVARADDSVLQKIMGFINEEKQKS